MDRQQVIHNVNASSIEPKAGGQDYVPTSFQVSEAAFKIRYEEVAPGS